MLTHPQFDPIAVRLGPLAVHWYGLTYLAAFTLFVLPCVYTLLAKPDKPPVGQAQTA